MAMNYICYRPPGCWSTRKKIITQHAAYTLAIVSDICRNNTLNYLKKNYMEKDHFQKYKDQIEKWVTKT